MSLQLALVRRLLPVVKTTMFAPLSPYTFAVTTRGMASKKVSSLFLSLQSKRWCWCTVLVSFNVRLTHHHLSTHPSFFFQHKNLLKHAKGFQGRSKNCFRIAIRRVEKAWQYAYRDRRVQRREWRKSWIQRIQSGVRQYDWRYSSFIPALQQANIQMKQSQGIGRFGSQWTVCLQGRSGCSQSDDCYHYCYNY
jgi:large subunit ribosomal protein L20